MEKEEVLENYALAYQAERYPPLSGRIMGLFMVTGKKYLSFEEIKDELGVSKGALSKMLNLLISIKRITFVKDERNPRRRLFCVDIEGINDHLKMVADNFEWEANLLREAKKLREDGDAEVCDFIDNSIEFSEAIITEIRELTKKHFN